MYFMIKKYIIFFATEQPSRYNKKKIPRVPKHLVDNDLVDGLPIDIKLSQALVYNCFIVFYIDLYFYYFGYTLVQQGKKQLYINGAITSYTYFIEVAIVMEFKKENNLSIQSIVIHAKYKQRQTPMLWLVSPINSGCISKLE